MKNLLITTLMICLIFVSCNEKKPETLIKKDSAESMTIKTDTAETIKKELKTATGKVFTIIETKPAYSLSNYMITGEGFENSNDTLKFVNKNPMTATLLSDLNGDGFEELYIITKATGDERFLDILAFTSRKDNTFNEIFVEPIISEDVREGNMFDGYMGHDSIYIDGINLIREFPVYETSTYEEDKNQMRRKIIYSLDPVGDQYKLWISGFKNIK